MKDNVTKGLTLKELKEIDIKIKKEIIIEELKLRTMTSKEIKTFLKADFLGIVEVIEKYNN